MAGSSNRIDMNPVKTLQDFIVSQNPVFGGPKPVEWKLPSYTITGGPPAAWKAKAILKMPNHSQRLTATGVATTKLGAKKAAAISLLEQLEQLGLYSANPQEQGTKEAAAAGNFLEQLEKLDLHTASQEQLEALLFAHDPLGTTFAIYYEPKRIEGPGHMPTWEAEVMVVKPLDPTSSTHTLLSKVVEFTGSKAAAQGAAAQAMLLDPAFKELIDGAMQEGSCSA